MFHLLHSEYDNDHAGKDEDSASHDLSNQCFFISLPLYAHSLVWRYPLYCDCAILIECEVFVQKGDLHHVGFLATVMMSHLNEDKSKIPAGHGAENFSLLKRCALNLVKAVTTEKVSISLKRRMAGWNPAYRLKLLGVK